MSINTAPIFVTLPKLSGGKVSLNVNHIAGWSTTKNGFSKINMVNEGMPINLAITFDDVSALVAAAIVAEPGRG